MYYTAKTMKIISCKHWSEERSLVEDMWHALLLLSFYNSNQIINTLQSQAAAQPSGNVASAGIKDMWTPERKVVMEGWMPRTQRSHDLLNWVLPSTESTIPNFCYRENSEWRGFHLLPYRRTVFTSRAQEFSDVTANPSIMRGMPMHKTARSYTDAKEWREQQAGKVISRCCSRTRTSRERTSRTLRVGAPSKKNCRGDQWVDVWHETNSKCTQNGSRATFGKNNPTWLLNFKINT